LITLVLGGARSGKSEVAERLAGAGDGPVTYVATGTATDEEMAARIAAHRERRPGNWQTVEEAGPALPRVLVDLTGPALIDSLTTWLAAASEFALDAEALCTALAKRDGDTVVVSDEVGLGVHPSTEAGNRFRDALGVLNQRVAAMADEVVLVVAGRTLRLS
jgi:adenosyl cobinamide kinase/adenosyl cobinamide phosphate guanylyltransferase